MPGKNIQLADTFADDYDEQVAKNKWTGPGVLFNLTKEFIQEGQELLDLGIGTGASALPFFNAGLKITGVDASREMLRVCRSKNITESMFQVNLETTKLPFENQRFDVVISNALFHLIYPLEPLFSEVKRVLNPGGIFAFTFEDADDVMDYSLKESGVWETITETNVFTYKHELKYIKGLLKKNGFSLTKKQRFLAFVSKETEKEYYFTGIVSRESE